MDRESALLLGGGRALLLQVAHPLIAAGVAAHSPLRTRPLERLWRTLDLVLTIVFADAAGALCAAEQVGHVHRRVHGVLVDRVGRFPAGTPYDANDPALLLWVHATLVDTALQVYERFVAPLASEARVLYYEESKITARLLGIPDAMLPAALPDFAAYMEAMLRGDTLHVGPTSRDIAGAVLRPAVALPWRALFRGARLFTVGLLPAEIRGRYRLAWGPGREALLSAIAAVTRRVLPLLPDRLRVMPHAHRAAAGPTAQGRGAAAPRRQPGLTPRPHEA